MLSSAALKLALLAVPLLAASPLASAELRQGPTGVEYVKRFEASPVGTNCRYSCPLSLLNGQSLANAPGEEGIITRPVDNGPPIITPYTICIYANDNGSTNCYFDDDGQAISFGETGCPATAIPPPANCGTVFKRTLSPLEKVIRSRQYNPRRRATKQQ